MPYQSDPMQGAYTKPMQQPQQMTPGGLVTTPHPNYSGMAGQSGNGSNAVGMVQTGGGPTSATPNATQWQTNFGPVDTGTGAFQQFADASYNQAMDQMRPDMEAQRRATSQQLEARGLPMGSAAYNSEMNRMENQHSQALQSAAYGAQQAGLGAQNQFFNQSMQNNQFGLGQANQNHGMQFGYDQLANQRGIAQIGAAAQTGAAGIGARASMHAADLRNQLGLAQLTEGGRQFNATDAFRNQQLDSSNMWNAANAFNQFNQTNTNNWLAQQGANQNWFGNVQSQVGMGPGAQFTPVGGTAQNMLGAGQAQANANAGLWGGLSSGIGAYFGSQCDVTTKENIDYDSTKDGIDLFTFNYKGSKTRYRGPMAQLLIKSHPEALFKRLGKWMVDFSKLPVDMEIVHV